VPAAADPPGWSARPGLPGPRPPQLIRPAGLPGRSARAGLPGPSSPS